jgi:hypothetical protein
MRTELGKRGLEATGLKAELEQRLRAALKPKASKKASKPVASKPNASKPSKPVVDKASKPVSSKPTAAKIAAIAKIISELGVPESFVRGYAQSLVAEGVGTKTHFQRLDEAVMTKCGIKKGHMRAISASLPVEEGKKAIQPVAGKPKASKKRNGKDTSRPAKKTKANPKQAFRDDEIACSLIRALHQRFPNQPTLDNCYHGEDYNIHMSNLAMVALVEFVQAFLESVADCTECSAGHLWDWPAKNRTTCNTLVTSNSIQNLVDDFPPEMSATILESCDSVAKNFARQNKVKLTDLDTTTWTSMGSTADAECKDRDAEDELNRGKTGLQFNVGSVNRFFLLKNKTLSLGALLYAATMLECVCDEILEVAAKEAKDCARTFIRYPHLQLGIQGEWAPSAVISPDPYIVIHSLTCVLHFPPFDPLHQVHSEDSRGRRRGNPELEHLFSFASSVVEDAVGDDICWRVLPPGNEGIWPQIEKKMQSVPPAADCAWVWPTAIGNRPAWIPSAATDAKKAGNARKDGPHFEEPVRLYFKEWKQEAKLPWRTLRSTRGGASGSSAGITKQSKAKPARLAGDKPRWLTIGNGLYGPFLCDKK